MKIVRSLLSLVVFLQTVIAASRNDVLRRLCAIT